MTFTGPIYEEQQLAAYFLSSSVFCYPENIGLSILHAMGYGLPVVTSDKVEAQNPEIEALVDGYNGRFYPHGDVAKLADTLVELLTDSHLCASLGANALRTVAERFSLENMVSGFEQAIRAAHERCRKG